MPPRPFDLNLRHLRGLVATVSHDTLSAGAAAVSLSQPALTQGIAKLERQLAIDLLERRPKGVRPTTGGRLLAERVEAAFGHLATAVRRVLPARNRGFARPELLMTATQLHALLTVVDTGSFTVASSRSGITPPALHRAFRDLEQLCGTPLAERAGRSLSVTPAGRNLARGVRLAESELAAAISELSPDPGIGRRISIGAMPLSRAAVVPGAVAALLREDSRASVAVREGSWRELIEPLRDGVIDFMVGALRHPSPPDLVQEPLFVDRLIVVGRADHPLAVQARPSTSDLRAYGWIIGQSETPLRDFWHQLFAGGPLPSANVECGSVMVIRSLLRDTDLLALLSRDQVGVELEAGMLQQIGPPLGKGGRCIGITTRERWRPTAVQARFLALLREASSNHGLSEIQ